MFEYRITLPSCCTSSSCPHCCIPEEQLTFETKGKQFPVEHFRETFNVPLGFSNEVTMEMKFFAPVTTYCRNSRVMEVIKDPAYMEYRMLARRIFRKLPVSAADLESKLQGIANLGGYVGKIGHRGHFSLCL